MKKFIRICTALGLTAALAGFGAAFAAEEPTIAVQLNGETLTFTDAVPQVKDERVYLPFRAVFEALGAEVDWNAESGAILAKRDGKTLTMYPDSPTFTLEEGGEVTTVETNAAPFAMADEAGVWRTYVPVRFAAESFGCAVGWDQEAYTAIVVDGEKLVDEALAGKEFTYLKKWFDYSRKYNEGIWDSKADFTASLDLMGMPMEMSGAMTGTVQDTDKLNADMNIKVDLTEFVKGVELLAEQLGGEDVGLSEEDYAMLDALKEKGIDVNMRGNMGEGTFYMNMKSESDLLTAAGLDENDWYEMDMAELLEQSGMDWAELLELSRGNLGTAPAELIKEAVAAVELTSAANGYADLKNGVELVLNALSDSAFEKNGNTRSTTLLWEEEGVTVQGNLKLTMKKDAVVGYELGFDMTITEEDTEIAMGLLIGVDEKDNMTASIEMDMGGFITMSMDMTGGYSKGKTAPVTTLPANANVVDYFEAFGL